MGKYSKASGPREQAVKFAKAALVFQQEGPVSFQMEFTRSFHAQTAALMPVVRRLDGRTIEVSGQDVVEAWRWAYNALKPASTGDS